MVDVRGDAGPAVLLLPGGAEAVDGFFPGLVEGLTADPGVRVILYDRPEAPLAGAAADLHAMLGEAGLGPVVVIGQSLGGAVALLLARDHPEDVAGLVLLDPSPVNDAPAAAQVERTMRVVLALSRVPLAGRAIPALMRRAIERSIRKRDEPPAIRAARERMLDVDLEKLGRAAKGLGALAQGFREDELPKRPAAVVTADRKPAARMRRAHQRLAEALGAPLLSWPGAQHEVHLSHPGEVLEACRQVVRTLRA
ncbi:alpha/beta fold hydrolase [Dactylosporangium sp. CS-033363]|uniref:alpha/beta fold hydrolase n=1 Tax=Dactylosporangium sp. CS-033363 TaxID=3239935 RepID=UPI003D92C335